jgi:hypothetical protein
MITAAAPAFSPVQASVTSVTPPLSGNRDLRIPSQGHDLQLPYQSWRFPPSAKVLCLPILPPARRGILTLVRVTFGGRCNDGPFGQII